MHNAADFYNHLGHNLYVHNNYWFIDSYTFLGFIINQVA